MNGHYSGAIGPLVAEILTSKVAALVFTRHQGKRAKSASAYSWTSSKYFSWAVLVLQQDGHALQIIGLQDMDRFPAVGIAVDFNGVFCHRPNKPVEGCRATLKRACVGELCVSLEDSCISLYSGDS